jgi:ATP-dependent DNA helicase RecG
MSPIPLTLETDVKYLKGVGPARAEALAARAIRTVGDLLNYAPFRYEDRSRLTAVRDLVPGQSATVLVRVVSCGLTRTRRGIYLYDLAGRDASTPGGGLMRFVWFNALYLDRNKVFQQDQRVFFYGKAQRDRYGTGNLQMVQPQFEIVGPDEELAADALEIGRVTPIYEAIGAVSSRLIRRLMFTALNALEGTVPDPLPPSVIKAHRLPPRSAALRKMHFPGEDEPIDVVNRFRTEAQRRMIFEEFFSVGCALALRRREVKWTPGVAFELTPRVRQAIKTILPFHPTAAQKRSLKQIVEDMSRPHPMSRLLQGDVGSGKTIVALQAAIVAIENGYQVALMAPTEILAAQHYLYCKQLLEALKYPVELLISARKNKEKLEVKQGIASGRLKFVVGTHALIEGDVEFARLGLVVVDEQHRFGVLQRYALMQKGIAPHVLVMTATPIPRTFALTFYGDLDVSIIDQLPPGRIPITTRLVEGREREGVFQFVCERLRQGEQAYVVCPLIEESETLDLKAALITHQRLSAVEFAGFRVGLLHGRMASEEKDRVMREFKEGGIQVLVATTVIEVGVDVPNATVMMIEHAERFGLAQLHQLRGRIGRGRGRSFCFLMTGNSVTENAVERLNTLAQTNDGFKIAEADFKLRGPGEFLGTRQWGIPAFRIANLLRDQDILEWARRAAFDFVDHPPDQGELKDFISYLRRAWPAEYGLARVG